MKARRIRRAMAVVVVALGLLAFAGCGGDESSGAAGVGACIDASSAVVDCSDASAIQKLVSDQSAPDAIACVAIGDKPQTEVTVDGGTWCAEDL
jgi:hypothetical protein